MFGWLRKLFRRDSDDVPDAYKEDFPDPARQAQADEAENENIYKGYSTGQARGQGSGEDEGGDNGDEGGGEGENGGEEGEGGEEAGEGAE